jgi:flagellar assembly protein FliH
LFRIDRNLVNLAASRYIHVENEAFDADAAGESPDAAASKIALMREEMLAEARAEARAEMRAESQAEALATAQKIVDEAESEAREKAEQIVNIARDEAAELLVAARDQVEDDRRSAWQEGFTDGSDEGRRAYDEQLSASLKESDEKLRSVIEELYRERTSTYDGLEQEVVGLAIEIVRKLLSPSGEELNSMFMPLIGNALKQINPDGKIVIRVSPAEYERFFQSGSAVFELDGGVKVTASILRDISVGSGGCVIDTEDTTVNAGLDSQLRYVQLAFDRAGKENLY